MYLKNLVDIQMGQSPESKFYNYDKIGLPFYQGKADFGRINPIPKIWCSKSKKEAKPNDILISVRAPVGDLNINNEQSCIGRGLAAITCKPDVDMMYLYYHLKYLKPQLRHISTGSTFESINRSQLENLTIDYKPYSEQIKISNILQVVQRQIEVKEKLLRLYDLLIKSRFNELIIGDECDKLVFKDLFFCTTGKLDSNAAVKGGRYPFFTCAKEIFYINDYAFDQEALLLAGNNAAGKYDVKYYNGKFNAYQRTYILSLRKKGIYSIFKEQLEDKLKYLQSQSKGSTTRYLTMGILKKLTFLVPDMEIQLKLDKEIQQINKLKFAKIVYN